MHSVGAIRDAVTTLAPVLQSGYSTSVQFKRNVELCKRLWTLIEPIMNNIKLSANDEKILNLLIKKNHTLNDEASIDNELYLESKKNFGNLYVKFILYAATKSYKEYIHGRPTNGIIDKLKSLYKSSPINFHIWAEYWVQDMEFALRVVSLIRSDFEVSFRTKLDVNKDGIINEKEFLDFISKHKSPD